MKLQWFQHTLSWTKNLVRGTIWPDSGTKSLGTGNILTKFHGNPISWDLVQSKKSCSGNHNRVMCFDTALMLLILTAHYVLPGSLIHHPTLIHTLVRQQAFSSLALCLALFKLSPFYTNPFVSAKLFHMLLACPIYSTLTICSQQLLNEFFLPGKCTMPNSESHSLAQQLYRATHRPSADRNS